MQIVKKISFYLFIAISLTVAIWGYFKLKENKAPSISVLEHIDNSANCVIISNTINETVTLLTRQNLIWNKLNNDSGLYKINSSIHNLDSVSKIDNGFMRLFNNNDLYTCFFSQEKNINYLLILKVKELNNKSTINEFLNSRAKSCSINGADFSYEYLINKTNYFVAYYNGLLLLSESKKEIESSIKLPINSSMASDKEFNLLLKANGANDNIVYLNKQTDSIFSTTPLLNKAIYKTEIKPDNITLNGYALIPQLNQLFQNQKASVIDVYNYLPQQPSAIVGISLSDVLEYNKQLEAISNQQELNSLNDAWKYVSDTLLYNVKKDFFDNINKQLAVAYYPDGENINRITSIALNNTNQVIELLNVVNDSVFNLNETIIYKLKKTHQSIFSLIQSSDKNEYALITDDDLLILCNSQKAVQYYIQQSQNNLLINKDKAMLEYTSDNFSEPCHILHYNEQSLLTGKFAIPFILNQKNILSTQQAFSKISYTTKMLPTYWQVRLNGTYTNPKNENTSVDNNNLWEFETDSTITTEPFSFINHNTQENELCFQSSNNDLHLLNSVGNLIWTKKINEPIQSKIYIVDIFKNGKLQLLFNTKNYIHLIDRNGNYVQGYPIKAPAEITSQISLFDYDNNKDYRILIACANKHIYNYSIYGVKTEGFTPFKTQNIVHLPIQYVKVGQSDYLITIDTEGKIYAFSRKGEGRIALNNHTTTNLNSFSVLAGNTINNTKIVYTDDRDNLLNKISLTDKKESLKLGDEISNFKTQFNFVNDDAQEDIVCYGDGAIYGYDYFSNKLFEYFSTTSVYDNVQIVKTSSYTYIIAFDKTGNKIDVLNKTGKLEYSLVNVSKAPLIKDLYKNGKQYIIYINKNKLMCKALK